MAGHARVVTTGNVAVEKPLFDDTVIGVDALYEHNRAGLAAPLGSHLRPSWRGRTHMAALFAALPAFIVLIVLARDTAAKVGVVIYGVGVCAMFAVSTTYHRWVHSLRARSIWQRADHATIYAAIAGTSTPIFLVTMPARWSVPLLTVVWSGALAGVLIK